MTERGQSPGWRAGGRLIWRGYLGLAAVAVPAGAFLPGTMMRAVYLIVAVAALAALVFGTRRHRPVWSRPWWLLVAAVGVSLLAHVGWMSALGPSGSPRFPSWGDVFYPIAMCSLTASVYWWVRPGRYRGGTVDAAIAAVGGGAVSWVLVMAPLLFSDRYSGLRQVTFLCYAGLDVLILALTVRVAVVSRIRTVAYRLMVASAVLWVLADTVRYVLLFHPVAGMGRWNGLGWMVAYLLIGAAALHPSMTRSTGSMPRNPAPLSRGRLLTYMMLTALIGALSVVGLASVRPVSEACRLIVLVCLGCVTSVLLIARLAQLGAALNRRAHVDGLTGLGNRAALQEHLDRRAPRDRVLLVADLDGFRDFNGAFGHRAGDAVLVEIGHRIRAVAPSDAVVVRLHADAFGLLVDGGEEAVGGLAARLFDAVGQPYVGSGLTTRCLQVSIGAVTVPAGADATTALRDADLALERAHSTGGERLAVFDRAAYAQWRANRDLVAQLDQALADDEFAVHYQPIVATGGGDIVAAEALLRWTRPDGTRIPPDRFIPFAEQSGAIVAIGEWVLTQVCHDLRQLWHEHRLSVTVNVSAHQLRDPAFAARLLQRLTDTGIPGRALIVEITETVLVTEVTDAATVTAQLHQLRAHGVRIAVDDFGTGYSSLAYLRELPVDILKMDGSFTTQVQDGNARDLALVRTIIELGHSLELVTLAEAVETAGQHEVLRDLGCDLAQGYHFAKPAPVATLHQLLAAGRPGELLASAADVS